MVKEKRKEMFTGNLKDCKISEENDKKTITCEVEDAVKVISKTD